jgi:hypothetical protein
MLSIMGSGTTISTLLSNPEKVIHRIARTVAFPKRFRDLLSEQLDEGGTAVFA